MVFFRLNPLRQVGLLRQCDGRSKDKQQNKIMFLENLSANHHPQREVSHLIDMYNGQSC